MLFQSIVHVLRTVHSPLMIYLWWFLKKNSNRCFWSLKSLDISYYMSRPCLPSPFHLRHLWEPQPMSHYLSAERQASGASPNRGLSDNIVQKVIQTFDFNYCTYCSLTWIAPSGLSWRICLGELSSLRMKPSYRTIQIRSWVNVRRTTRAVKSYV